MEIEPDWSRAQLVRPSVSAVVCRDGRLLLQQRADGGQWGLPGGSIEVGETVIQALEREVREETGFEVTVGRLIGVYSDPRVQVVRYPDGRVWHYVNLCFACAVRGGSPRPQPGETLALGWFALDDLPADLHPVHRPRIADALADRPEPVIR